MNEDVKQHINEALNKGIRLDGRKKEEFRSLEIEKNFIATAESSVMVKCGESEVIVGVKMTVDKPFPDTPEEGVMMVGAELLPLSNPDFESGPPGIKSIEVSRVIDRGIRESHTIDTKKLCIVPGEKVWVVNIDIIPINHDGNLIDLGFLASMIALKNTVFPKLDENNNIEYGKKTKTKLPLVHEPIEVTVIKIGDNFIIDPTDAEEDVLDARLTVAFMETGDPCAIQKGGNSPLTKDDIGKMIDLAFEKSKELRAHLK